LESDIKELILENNALIPELFGSQDLNLKLIEKKFNIRITTRENQIKLKGNPKDIETVENLFMQLEKLHEANLPVANGDVKFAIRLMADDPQVDLQTIFSERIAVSPKKGYVTPKGPTQHQFIQSIRKNDIVLSIGPAGTGKTFLAVAKAVSCLQKGLIKKIILSRPAVEAGEKLGFLPGDLKEKVDPFLRPIYDALYEMMPYDQVEKKIENGTIEIAPIAFMRGRTLEECYIILDEAQNTTKIQMKMFLTRFGKNSKMVVVGDKTQIDLVTKHDSGLLDAEIKLKNMKDIGFIYLNDKDVIRHELVRKIINSYEKVND